MKRTPVLERRRPVRAAVGGGLVRDGIEQLFRQPERLRIDGQEQQ